MKVKNNLHIMFIDNDRHVRDSLKVLFDTSRTQFLIFKSGEQGLNSLKYQQVSLVVSDYFLPDMDGIEFLKQAARIQPGVRRILMATIASEGLEQEIIEAGIDRFIEKPLTVASLDTVINELKPLNLSNQSWR
ncbi:MAG: response regulator [Desulfobacter sp.]|nr:response regulator [Desulfobacter sp.]WDP86108.1 MAG: response regulator [Desulfobacter sp.]